MEHLNKSPEIKGKVDQALLAYVYSQTKIGLLTSLLCASVILYGMYQPGDNTTLFTWYGFFLAVTASRFIIAESYHRKFDAKNIVFWRNLFIAGAFVGGLSWGLIGVVLFPGATAAQQTLMILILAGVTAGAVPILAAVFRAAIAFLVPALVILIVQLFFIKDYLLFDMAVSIYFTYLIIISVKTYQLMKLSVSLQFENSALIENLLVLKNKLEYSSTHDPLTNVANRNLFKIHLDNAIQRAKRNNTMFCLLYIDLDNFKQINDHYGHHVGDRLLLAVVARLKGVLREIDTISRLGGDEFTIILENITNINYVKEISSRICDVIAKNFNTQGYEFHITTSIGISVYPMDSLSAEELLRLADKAMYHTKEHGRNNFCFNLDLEKTPETPVV